MPSGYHIGATDLDSIFATLQGGMTPAAATGYQVGGVDLNARYAPLSYGSAAAATGFESAGNDLNTIFAAFGSTNIVFTTQPSNVSGTAAAGSPSGVVTSSGVMTVSVSGGHPPYTYTWNVSGGGVANSPNSPTTFISGTVNATSNLSGTAYCNVQDSTGRSVNSNLASYSLTNTSVNSVTFSFIAKFDDDSYAYVSQSFFGPGGAAQNATPTEPVLLGSGQQLISLGWNAETNPPNGVLVLTTSAIGGVASTQGLVISISVPGAFGGALNLLGSAASFSHFPSLLYSQWTWDTPEQTFLPGTSYTVTVVFNP
jgi:hypothetical protein